jgi:FkbM family methyltransferase
MESKIKIKGDSINIIYKNLMRIRPASLASFIKKIFRIKRFFLETEYGVFYIDPVSNFGDALITNGVYELDLTNYFKNTLKEGDVFIDIGANEGYYSILSASLVGNKGKVFAVEPQSRLQNILFNNIEENKTFNVKVFQNAISDKIGTALINLTPDMNTGSSGMFRSTKYKCPTEIIPQTTLSDFFSLLNITNVKLLKMDIEGFEYYAILGSKEIFKNNIIENIALEFHPEIIKEHGYNVDEILKFLKDAGYKKDKKYIIDDDSTIIFSK